MYVCLVTNPYFCNEDDIFFTYLYFLWQFFLLTLLHTVFSVFKKRDDIGF